MKTQYKMVIAIMVIVVIVFGGYYAYQEYKFNKRIQESDKIMKDKGIELNNKDKDIVDEMLKNNSDLEYAYISHNGETVMLNLKFKKGIQDKDKYEKVSKFMEKVTAEYKGKNVNASIIPSK